MVHSFQPSELPEPAEHASLQAVCRMRRLTHRSFPRGISGGLHVDEVWALREPVLHPESGFALSSVVFISDPPFAEGVHLERLIDGSEKSS
jgi:hypothetical protein